MQFAVGALLPAALYIGGEFVAPRAGQTEAIINPATEEPIGMAPLGDVEDARAAVAAARVAFDR